MENFIFCAVWKRKEHLKSEGIQSQSNKWKNYFIISKIEY